MRRFTAKKLALARALDPLLGALFFCLGLRRRPGPIDDREIRRILVFEFQFLGDVVMATPALRALRKRFPRASITLAAPASAAGIERHLPWVDRVVTFDCPWASHRYDWASLVRTCRFVKRLRSTPWDLTVEVRGDLRNILLAFFTGARRRVSFAVTGGDYLLTDVVPYQAGHLKHQLEGNLEVMKYLGCDIGENFPELAIDEEADRSVRDTLVGLGRPLIGLHPCASRANKWWEISKWVEVADRLVEEHGATLVLIHGPAATDREMISRIGESVRHKERCLSYSRSLSHLIAMIGRLDLLIALDSVASHIAAAVRTPFVTLFGPQDPDYIRPYHFLGRVVIGEGFPCDCGGECRYGSDNRCMKAIETGDVLKAARDVLRDRLEAERGHTTMREPPLGGARHEQNEIR